ncbi:hypothetical protein MG293_001531 [Ovis ammon polii]|uniref:Uncharacterized protein n=1 Tax=Ovis ammon polii TaxID=230172 RepID=A0AAD4UN80_OVIAM|nr:hypothetical protein MG293_001531 [Ovis ammon polii]
MWLTHCQHLSPLVPAPAQMPLLGLSGDPGQGLFLPLGGGDHSRLSLDSFPLSLIPKAKRKPFSGKNDSLWLFWAPGASPSLTASPLLPLVIPAQGLPAAGPLHA